MLSINRFWIWYEKHYTLNLSIASFLFVWQIIHLTWLFTNVIWDRLFGFTLWNPNDFWEQIIIYVDYTEIPAIISVGLVYINELRQKFTRREFLYSIFLFSQIFHIFWITDEFVVSSFAGQSIVGLPSGLAWIAILIDYLEIPVMIDTAKRLIKRLKTKV